MSRIVAAVALATAIAVVRKVATLDALVAFSFTESGLSFVAVRFPAPGTSVVTKGRIGYMRPTKAQAGHIVPIARRRHAPQLRPAEVARHLVAGVEVADREEAAGAVERDGHGAMLARGNDTCRLRPRAALLVPVRLQARFLRSLPRVVKSIARRGRDSNAFHAELAVHAVARTAAWDRPQRTRADALNVCHEVPVAGCRWRRRTIAHRARKGLPGGGEGRRPSPAVNHPRHPAALTRARRAPRRAPRIAPAGTSSCEHSGASLETIESTDEKSGGAGNRIGPMVYQDRQ
jgi:hypothetical protein